MRSTFLNCLLMTVMSAMFSSPPAFALDDQCLAGELPLNSMPKEFVRPRMSLECWRAPREGGGRGVHFRARFDVTPEGATENIRITAIDPICAKEPIIGMIEQWRYDCSDEGRKDMRATMNIQSSVN